MDDPSVHVAGGSRRTDWLSLGPAARLLGVDADTLRRWADAGRIEAFTTPGGHRRFSRRSIERLISARRPRGASPLGATADRLSAAYRRRAVNHPSFRVATPLDVAAREAVRVDGRGLVDSLVRYLDEQETAARDRIEGEATELAVGLARRLAAAGVRLPDAVARFVVAREPLLDEILAVARRRHLGADRLATVFADASSILDRLLLAFVAAHDAALVPTGPEGAAPAAPPSAEPVELSPAPRRSP
ncbi:MAG TPA: helix-turn-helix domain-containing protein [Candidatus Dormibacteraeota bacterium]|nr:helix-turn-helix domain-containing protein [Candidatus Dormibacteraeota bacterium]